MTWTRAWKARTGRQEPIFLYFHLREKEKELEHFAGRAAVEAACGDKEKWKQNPSLPPYFRRLWDGGGRDRWAEGVWPCRWREAKLWTTLRTQAAAECLRVDEKKQETGQSAKSRDLWADPKGPRWDWQGRVNQNTETVTSRFLSTEHMNPGQKQATRGLFGGVMTTGNKKETSSVKSGWISLRN